MSARNSGWPRRRSLSTGKGNIIISMIHQSSQSTSHSNHWSLWLQVCGPYVIPIWAGDANGIRSFSYSCVDITWSCANQLYACLWRMYSVAVSILIHCNLIIMRTFLISYQLLSRGLYHEGRILELGPKTPHLLYQNPPPSHLAQLPPANMSLSTVDVVNLNPLSGTP